MAGIRDESLTKETHWELRKFGVRITRHKGGWLFLGNGTAVNLSSACPPTIPAWTRCCPTAGRRHIQRLFSPIGWTNPEPKPLAHEHVVLIAAPASGNAASLSPPWIGRTLTL